MKKIIEDIKELITDIKKINEPEDTYEIIYIKEDDDNFLKDIEQLCEIDISFEAIIFSKKNLVNKMEIDYK